MTFSGPQAYFWIGLYIGIGFIAVRYIERLIIGERRLSERFFWQYVFCFSLSFLYFGLNGGALSAAFWTIVGIGILNGTANFTRWQAMRIAGLANVSVLTFFDDLVAMTLSYIIIKEERNLMNWPIAIGIIISVVCAILLAFERHKKKEPFAFLFLAYVGIYSVLWGVCYFSQRYFALAGISPAEYLLAWYGGTFVVAQAIFIRNLGKDKDKPSLGQKDCLIIAGLASLIWCSLWIALNVLRYVPQVGFQPILLDAEAILPTFVGLYLFGEKSSLNAKQKALMAFSLIGVVLIALGLPKQ
jgi:hypothetical protein